MFSEAFYMMLLKHDIIWLKLFNLFPNNPTTLKKKPFENIVGKGVNAGDQHFRLFL